MRPASSLLLIFLFYCTLLSAQQPKLTLPVGHKENIFRADYSPDGKLVVSSGSGSSVFLWEAATGKIIKAFHLPEQGGLVAWFDSTGKYIITFSGSFSDNTCVWDIKTGEVITRATADNLYNVSLTRGGKLVINNRDSVFVHDIHTKRVFRQSKSAGTPVFLTGDILKTVIEKDKVFAFQNRDIRTGRPIAAPVPVHGLVVPEKDAGYTIQRVKYGMSFSNTGKYFTSQDNDTLRLYNALSGKVIRSYHKAHGSYFTPGDRFFILHSGYYIDADTLSVIDLKDLSTIFYTGLPLGINNMVCCTDSAVYTIIKYREAIADTGMLTISRLYKLDTYNKKQTGIRIIYGNVADILVRGNYILACYDDETSPGEIKKKNKMVAINWHSGAATMINGSFYNEQSSLLYGDNLLTINNADYTIQQWNISANNITTVFRGNNNKPAVLSFIDSSRYIFTGNKLIDIYSANTIAHYPGIFKELDPKKKFVRSVLGNDSATIIYDIHNGAIQAAAKGSFIETGIDNNWNYLFTQDDDSVLVTGIKSNVRYKLAGEFMAMDENNRVLVTAIGPYSAIIGWSYTKADATGKDTDTSSVFFTDVATGKQLKRFDASYQDIAYDSLGNFGYLFLGRIERNGATPSEQTLVYNFSTGKLLQLPGRYEKVEDDNGLFTAILNGKEIKYELPSGTVFTGNYYVSRKKIPVSWGNGKDIDLEQTSKDGLYRLVHFTDSTAIVVSVAGDFSSQRFRLVLPDDIVIKKLDAFCVTADRNYAFYSVFMEEPEIVNLATGATVSLKQLMLAEGFLTAYFSDNARYLITTSRIPTNYSVAIFLSVWDRQTGERVIHVEGDLENKQYLFAFSNDSKYSVIYADGVIRIYETAKGKLLYSYLDIDKDNSLVFDNDFHFDGTEAARNLLYYTCGTEIIELQQFKDLNWEPSLVSKIMGINKEPITAKKLSEINICNTTPVVEEKGIKNNAYRYRITPRSGGVGEIRLYVNSKLVKIFSPAALSKINGSYQLAVKREDIGSYLVSGIENLVEVKATTAAGNMQSRGVTIKAAVEQKSAPDPDMYIISIGISQYKGAALKLGYASKDAIDFSAALTMAAAKLLNNDGRQHVFSYNFNTEPGSVMWPAKSSIAAVFDSVALKAKANDIVIIFFAGHGALIEGEKNLYLLTAEATGFRLKGIEKEISVSTIELNNWMRKIKANKQVLILDACNSGQAVQNLQELIARRSVPADQQRALEGLKDKTGTFILAASAAGQSAYETSLYGQGLLTYSLLSAIKIGTGLKDNKYINMSSWFNVASDEVRLLAKDIGGRQDPQLIGAAAYDVGLVDKEVSDAIKLSLKKKIFRRSRFIEDEELLNDDLELALLTDKELVNVSSRGKESPLAYVADNTMSDAYSIRGRYEVNGNRLTIKASLFKGQKEKVYETEISGTVDRKGEAVKNLVEQVQHYLDSKIRE